MGFLLAAVLPAIGAIYPSADAVPRRLLRVTVVFAQPVDAAEPPEFGLRSNGRTIVMPFADPAVWSADQRTVTLFLDPSRQKIGLRNHDATGYVLPDRGDVTLTANGEPIRSWRVDGETCAPLDPARWSFNSVHAGTRDALVVTFAGAIDALSAPYLAVADARGLRLAGTARLEAGERTWRFAPSTAWSAGATLVVHPHLEDPCGNEIVEAFEHRAGAGTRDDGIRVPLRVEHAGVRLSTSARVKGETITARGWDPAAGSDTYVLRRVVVHGESALGSLRVTVEAESSGVVGGRKSDPTWRDAFATPSAYLGVPLGTRADATIGRQRIAFGAGRVLDDRAGSNTIQPFDGVRIRVRPPGWAVAAFALRPVSVASGAFDDLGDRARALSGLYASRRGGAYGVDAYVVIDDRRSVTYLRGTAPERRTTAGLRVAGKHGSFDADIEAMLQRGRFGELPIRAFGIEGDAGTSRSFGRARVRAGIGAGWNSGDRGGGVLRTFRVPYPTGLTFGILPGANGNGNTAGFAPALSYANADLSVALKAYTYYRSSTRDGIYSTAGIPLRPARGDAVHIGELTSMTVTDKLSSRARVSVALASYRAGAYLRTNGIRPGVPSVSTTYGSLGWDYAP